MPDGPRVSGNRTFDGNAAVSREPDDLARRDACNGPGAYARDDRVHDGHGVNRTKRLGSRQFGERHGRGVVVHHEATLATSGPRRLERKTAVLLRLCADGVRSCGAAVTNG